MYSPVTLSLHTLSLWSLCLPFLCYHVFYYFCPLCLSVFCSPVTLSFTYSVPLIIMSSVPLLPYFLLLLSLMSLCLLFTCYFVFYILSPFGHYVFRSSVTMSSITFVPYVFLSFVHLLLCLYILSPLCLSVILAS